MKSSLVSHQGKEDIRKDASIQHNVASRTERHRKEVSRPRFKVRIKNRFLDVYEN